MSSRSSTSSSSRGLALVGLVLLVLWGVLELADLPPTAFFGGRRLAEKWLRLEALEREGPLDVLVLGASQIDQGFDARAFGQRAGVRAFNLGVSGTDMYFQSLLLRQLLASGRRPRAVVWASIDRTQWQTSINRQYLTAPALRWSQGPLGAHALELGRHLPQFQRRRLLDWWSELAGEPAEPVDAFGRLQLAAEHRPAQAEGAGAPEGGHDYGLDLAGVRAHVEETLRLLRASDGKGSQVRVWLLFTPYAEELFTRDSEHARRTLLGASDGHSEWITRVARELGLELLDLHHCAEISSDPALFYDATHLNGAGSLRLGALLGELYSGARPIPDEWRGLPSPAERAAIFGHEPPARPVQLLPGQPLRLAESPELFATDARLDLYAAVTLAEPGDYRLVLSDRSARPREGRYCLRIGTGSYRPWRPERAAGSGSSRWSLEAGTHLLELHAMTGATLDWDELVLVREPSPEPAPR